MDQFKFGDHDIRALGPAAGGGDHSGNGGGSVAGGGRGGCCVVLPRLARLTLGMIDGGCEGLDLRELAPALQEVTLSDNWLPFMRTADGHPALKSLVYDSRTRDDLAYVHAGFEGYQEGGGRPRGARGSAAPRGVQDSARRIL